MRFEFWPYDEKRVDVSEPPTVVEGDLPLDQTVEAHAKSIAVPGAPYSAVLVRQENWPPGRYIAFKYRLDYVRDLVKDIHI